MTPLIITWSLDRGEWVSLTPQSLCPLSPLNKKMDRPYSLLDILDKIQGPAEIPDNFAKQL
jgi:hypothetical protein